MSEKLMAEVGAWVRERSAQVDHLERALEWAQELDPRASAQVLLAALSHDMERAFPEGSPPWAEGCWADPLYRMAHSERSARIVGDFLRDHGAGEATARQVVLLIVAHELGGWPEADVVQAADSLSFLETIQPVIDAKLAAGELSAEGARRWLDFQHGRIRLRRAREMGRPLLRSAQERLELQLSRA